MPIFDQGYQHWKGHLSGHAWRWFAITRHGVRIGLQGRIFRMVLLIALLPAIVLAVALAVWGLIERRADIVSPIVGFLVSMHLLSPGVAADPRHYRLEIWTLCYNIFLSSQLTLSMVLILLVGPNLISQDLRFNALPLYLSRPLRRIDYLAGKLGVIAAFLGLVTIVPCLLTYALGLLFSFDLTIVRDTFGLLLASVAYGLVIILSAGMLILALSSLSRNSRYVALFWLCIWIVSGIVATVLETTDQVQHRQALQRQAAAPQPPTTKARARPAGDRARADRDRDEQRSQKQARRAENEKRFEDFELERMEAAKTDWRPLVSYTANLSRVGRQLLGTDAALRSLSELQPRGERRQFLLRASGPQYPWYWSAGVLAGLFGLSACILILSVRSLDRLR